MREPDDLVLDRWTVPRSDTLDATGDQRRPIESPADDVVGPGGRLRDPAIHLAWVHVAPTDKREHGRGLVSRLPDQRRKVDCPAIEARRRSGLQPAGRQL